MSTYRVAIVLAGVLSLLGSAGGLGLTWAMGLEACSLCFYQRAFVMSTFAILVVGGLAAGGRVNLAVLAFPSAIAGFVIALQHTRLVVNGVIECPEGFLALGSAPAQSLALHSLLVVVLAIGWLSGKADERGSVVAGLTGMILGVALALGCLNSNPPLKTPTRAYDPVKEPLLGCRKPYRETP